MRALRIILAGLTFAAFTMGFAAFSLAVAGEAYKPLPGFGDNANPIPKPVFRPVVMK